VQEFDIAILGAGAAGLMAAIEAGRRAPSARIVLLDGASRIGAKILVSGGRRCNVTHFEVSERAYAGSSRHAIRKVLRRLGVPETIAFFRDLGVELKREETGKLFPCSEKSSTVLGALVKGVAAAGVKLLHPWRVEHIERGDAGFLLSGPAGRLGARRLVLATGGKSLPKSGSDGQGLELARALGHTLTPHLHQGLVPLLLPARHFLRNLPGVALPARLELRGPGGKRLQAFEGAVLLTHFGLSGPCVMDISRYYLAARAQEEGVRLVVNWLPALSPAQLDAWLQGLRGRNPAEALALFLPQRLARALTGQAGLDPARARIDLTRATRGVLRTLLSALELPIVGPRGWAFAEVTAGGVPLGELRLGTLGSRPCPGLHLCGEILDVDGRIGGFNFQWAWASGFVAGHGVADAWAREERGPGGES